MHAQVTGRHLASPLSYAAMPQDNSQRNVAGSWMGTRRVVAVERTKVDRNGRVLLPAAIRRGLGLREGSELLVTLEEGGRVVLLTPASAWTRGAGAVRQRRANTIRRGRTRLGARVQCVVTSDVAPGGEHCVPTWRRESAGRRR